MRNHVTTFFLRPDGADGYSRLMFRLKWDGCRSIIEMSMGIKIDEKGWSQTVQRCRKGSFHGRKKIPAAAINREIERYENAAEAIFLQADDWPDVNDVRTRLRVQLGIEQQAESVVRASEAAEKFIKWGVSESGWSDGTVRKLTTLQHHLEDAAVLLNEMDCSGIGRYVEYLRDQGLSNTTCKKEVANLRWMLRWAYRRKMLASDDFENYAVSLKCPKNRVLFLTWPELMRLWDWQPPKNAPYLGRIRDMFCFGAFTSLRFSDLQKLQWSDVFEDSIFVLTKKTTDPLEIDLNKWSRSVLDRYSTGGRTGRVFPTMTDQVANRYLKRIAQECGIDELVTYTYMDKDGRHDVTSPKYELVTMHCARRTFICNALVLGVPPVTVMKWTGHSDYKAMKPYIDVADKERRKAMQLFDSLDGGGNSGTAL